jgi:hypothetical protein
VSSAEFPASLKKRSSGQYITADQGLIDISSQFNTNVPTAISSILKRKSDVSRSVDMTRHTIENQINPATGNTALSIVKRNKVPVSQAVAVVSKQKMVSTSIFHPEREESVSDIATFHQNQDIATVSGKAMTRPSKRKQNKNPFGNTPIQDAEYKELTGNILSEMESSGKYKVSKSFKPQSEAPRKASKEANTSWITGDSSPREFIRKGASAEPPAMRAISAQKQKTISNLAKSPQKHWGDDTLKSIDGTVDKYITNPATVAGGVAEYIGGTIKKGMQKQAKEIRDDISYELETNRQARATKNEYYKKQHEIAQVTRRFNKIEQAKKDGIYYGNTNVAERTLHRAQKVQKVGNQLIKATAPIIGDAFRAIDAGATAFSNSTIGKNLNRNAETEFQQLRLTGTRARGSIITCGNKGSLVTQHNFATNNTKYNTGANAGSSSSYGGVYCKYERGLGGRPELHFYSANSGRRITHTQVSLILPKQIISKLKQEAKSRIFGQPVQANVASSTPVQPIQTINKPTLGNQRTKTLNRPKVATKSGLVHRNKSGVV